MAQTIKLKNSGTSSNTPSSLEHGELAINYADGKIFYKNSSNNIVEFANLSGSFLPLSGGTLTGNLSLGDNVKAIFGASDDLTISHSTTGNHSIITESGAGNLILAADNLEINNAANNENKIVATSDGAVTLYHNNQAKIATVSGGIQVTGDISNASGDLTLDVAADIILNADGGDWKFSDGSDAILEIQNDGSGNAVIITPTSDKDMKFLGNDGGSTITALTLDMSAAGEATFNSDIFLFDSKVLRLGNDQDFRISFDGSHGIIQNVTTDSDIIFKGKDGSFSINALTLDMSNGGAATFNSTISSGAITVDHTDGTDNISLTPTSTGGVINARNSSGTSVVVMDGRGTPFIDVTGNLKTGGTTRIDSSGNLSSIGTISSGAITSTGLTVSTTYPKLQLNDTQGVARNFSLGTNNETFTIRNETASSDSLTISNANIVNIPQSLMVGSTTAPDTALHVQTSADTIIKVEKTGGNYIQLHGTGAGGRIKSDGQINFDVGSNSGALNLASNGNATFLGSVTSTGLTASTSGNQTLLIDSTGGVSSIQFRTGSGSISNYIRSGLGGSAVLQFMTGGENERMRLDSSGRLGIGTTSIPHLLTVKGTISRVNSSGIQIINLEANSDAGQISVNNSSGTQRVKLSSNATSFFTGGNLAIGTSSAASLLTVEGDIRQTTGDLLYQGGGNWDIKHLADNQNIVFYTSQSGSATEKLRIKANGFVGIGKAAPEFTLDVLGGAGSTTARFANNAAEDTLVRIIAGNYQTDRDARLFLGEDNTHGMTLEYDGVANIGYIGMNNSVDPTGAYSKRIQMSRSGTEVAFMAGDVGIGLTATDSLLHLEQDAVALSTSTLDDGTVVGLHVTIPDQAISGTPGIAIALGMNGRGRSYLANIHSGTNKDSSNLLIYTENGGTIGERMRIDSSGRVGIGSATGASAFGTKLFVEDSGSGLAIFNRVGSGGLTIAADNDGPILAPLDNADSFRIFTGAAERVRIDSSGNFGIGTSLPTSFINTGNYFKPSTLGTAKFLTIDGGTNAANIMLQGNITGENPLGGIYWTSTNGQSDAHRQVAAIDVQIDDHSTNSALDGGSLRFFTKPAGSGVQSPRMTLLANGNLIVGTTNETWQSVAGLRYFTGNSLIVTRDSNEPMNLNRLTNDGNLLSFRKDGTLVGNIGNNTDFFIASQDGTGLRFQSDKVLPCDEGGNLQNGSRSLGTTSSRFKDAHLSGTVNCGAVTASGNIASSGVSHPEFELIPSGSVGNADIRFDGTSLDIRSNSNGAHLTLQTATTERMRISNSGIVMIGLTSTGNTDGLFFRQDGRASFLPTSLSGGSAVEIARGSNGTAINFQQINGNVDVGSISVTGTATAYNTSSDARLKDNIEDANDSGTAIDSLQVRQFDWKSDGKHEDYGMIAQEVIHTCPNAVSVPQEDGEMMGIDYSKMVPLLLKEIQELRKRVKKLEE